MAIFIPTGRQLAAARALVGASQAEISSSARISVQTLKRMEASSDKVSAHAQTLSSVIDALEAAGVEFIPENGSGPGVRLRKS